MASLLAVVSALLAILIVYFFTKLYNARKLIWERREMGLVSLSSIIQRRSRSLHSFTADRSRPQLVFRPSALPEKRPGRAAQAPVVPLRPERYLPGRV